jgi:hypothetical protein
VLGNVKKLSKFRRDDRSSHAPAIARVVRRQKFVICKQPGKLIGFVAINLLFLDKRVFQSACGSEGGLIGDLL